MSLPTLGAFDSAVLLTVARLHDDAYGARIRQDVSARLGRECAIGAIYAALQRLEDRALVTACAGEATIARGGRPTRCYRVTALADATLRASRASVIHLRDAVSTAR